MKTDKNGLINHATASAIYTKYQGNRLMNGKSTSSPSSTTSPTFLDPGLLFYPNGKWDVVLFAFPLAFFNLPSYDYTVNTCLHRHLLLWDKKGIMTEYDAAAVL
jgi:hypothetical protein